MSHLKAMLQDADPLRHEDPHLDVVRERVWLMMPAVAPVASITGWHARRWFVAALAIFVVVGALVYQVWNHGSTPVLAAVRFEVRLAEDQPIPGLVVARVANLDRVIYLHPEIVVNNDDVAGSWVRQDDPTHFG